MPANYAGFIQRDIAAILHGCVVSDCGGGVRDLNPSNKVNSGNAVIVIRVAIIASAACNNNEEQVINGVIAIAEASCNREESPLPERERERE